MLETSLVDGILSDARTALKHGRNGRAWLLISSVLPALADGTSDLPHSQQEQSATLAAEIAIAAGKPDVALGWAEKAIILSNRKAWPLHLMAVAWQDLGHKEHAVPLWYESLSGDTHIPEAYQGLAAVLGTLGRYPEARAVWAVALRLWPTVGDYWLRHGLTCARLFAWDQAVQSLEQAHALMPTSAEVATSLGWVLRRQGDFAKALAWQEKAVQLAPESAEAHWNLATAQLSMGQYREGFCSFEWRFRRGRALITGRAIPLWDGHADLSGKAVLISREQGIGDALQMLRFARPLAELGAVVLWEAHSGLDDIAATAPGVHAVVSEATLGNYGRIAYQIPAMSLPFILGIATAEELSAPPYLSAPAGQAPVLPPRLGGRIRVGLVWRGNPAHEDDLARSIPLPALQQLIQASTEKGVDWVSLQRPDNRPDFDPAQHQGWFAADLGPCLDSFAQTARAVQALDLVISVDTAVLHLAAAMGRPTWGLLPLASDWRWQVGRDDSPWYPSLRLFRQQPGEAKRKPAAQDGDLHHAWQPVLWRVQQALESELLIPKASV